MTKELNKAEFWNFASLAGLCIGAIPVVHGLINKTLIGVDNIVVGNLVAIILWTVKFLAGIYLTKFFMDRYRTKVSDASYKTLSRFGMVTGICAALIYSGFNLADMLVISPEFYEEAFNQTYASVSSLLDSNTMSAMEKSMGQLPVITFFSNLIYCSLYGVLLGTILARYITAKHFFDKVYKEGAPFRFDPEAKQEDIHNESIDEQDGEDDKSKQQ